MLKRKEFIEKNLEAFTYLAVKVNLLSCLNLQDLNIHLENTFRDLLNLIYIDRKFKNLNSAVGNFTAIDLGDDKLEIAFQITSTTSRKKVSETILKHKTDGEYKNVIMLYCVMDKPDRKDGFDTLTEGVFTVEEWDLKDLLKKISDCEFDTLESITNLIRKDILTVIPEQEKIDDFSAIEGWEKTVPTDIRNIIDKLKSVCDSIQEYRINKYCRDIAIGKVELSKHSERYISALKYRIFDVCQEELMEFYESREENILSVSEINSLIERYTNRAVLIIEDKSKDYIYPLKNRDILRKTVLALIDECYLSFDKEGIYS